jgi:acyl carrier protein
LADGNLEFLGRRDQQVKIRGYRIEPGEIENRLLQFEWIKEVVVTPVEDKKNLCAYVVPISTFEGELDIDALKTGLSVHLPEYMIPAYFVRMDRLPLTPSGKTDRRALPLPERKSADSVVEAPRNEIEEKMVELWAEVLGIKKELIGVNENFFKLGGHSLKAAMLAAKIFKVFNVKVPLMKIFETPTVEGICSLISLSEWIWEQEKEKEFNVEEEEEVIL